MMPIMRYRHEFFISFIGVTSYAAGSYVTIMKISALIWVDGFAR